MTWKVLAEVKFSNALAVAFVPQLSVLYTVPATKSALIKEILLTPTKVLGGRFFIYVLKSAGTDLGAGAGTSVLFSNIENLVANPGADTHPETVNAGLGAALDPIVLARTTFLATGDAIKLMFLTGAADAADTNRAKILISGDEF